MEALFEIIATATFGLEAVVKREVETLGYRILKTEDGRVCYEGDARAIVRSNLWLRSADRVYIKISEFDASTFEELFQLTKGISWESYLPLDASFPVVGTSVKSELHSVPACQSIIKKAIVERLKDFYVIDGTEGSHFIGGENKGGGAILPETGAEHRVRFSILKDHVLLMLDTSGEGLHKRGYRVKNVDAPMKETLAAALVSLSFWKERAMRRGRDEEEEHEARVLVDPCCGSGTILIEAAMMARNIAPGLGRQFASEKWDFISQDLWKEERKAAYDAIYDETASNACYIKGFDISAKAIEAARANADEAGVAEDISFGKINIKKFLASEKSGIIISNPPYGERIGTDKSIREIYERFAGILREKKSWSLFIITADKDLEKKLGRRADRKRKLYNGRIETTYYQFHGERPKKGR